jgi:hypothetical protein
MLDEPSLSVSLSLIPPGTFSGRIASEIARRMARGDSTRERGIALELRGGLIGVKVDMDDWLLGDMQ